MHRFGKYKATDIMSDLISENHSILLVMSRFGISLGFGDKTIGEVCRQNEVDTKTFLSIANMLLGGAESAGFTDNSLSVTSLISYLQNSHIYFLEFRLPGIRDELIEVLKTGQSDLSQVIIKYFDEYVDEVRKHMMYEEETVFPYVRSLLQGEQQGKYTIEIFRRRHEQIETRLAEFKRIIIQYYPAKSTNEINNVLFDIFNCEHDLASHNGIEDKLFVPAIMAMERKIGKS
jgi:regulator of cell morphogenesis and NO signaling